MEFYCVTFVGIISEKNRKALNIIVILYYN